MSIGMEVLRYQLASKDVGLFSEEYWRCGVR